MTFKVSEVDLDNDWDEFFAAEWAAWMHPPQAFWEIFFPIIGSGHDAEVVAIREGAARQLQGSRADPHDQWIKVVDTDTGKIIAGALWKFYDTNPYRAPLNPFDAVWCPAGELRELCNEMYTQLRAWRPRTMAEAHAWLNILFTHPDYRNQGAAGLLVDWGTEQADNLGIEAYVEGSYLGRSVYERHGFVKMHVAEMDFHNECPGEEWKRLVKDMQLILSPSCGDQRVVNMSLGEL